MTTTTCLRMRRGSRLVAVAMATVASMWLITPTSAHATVDTPLDVGDLVVVNAGDNSKELVEADSDTAFGVRLPDGSTCPGDSANDQWRIQSFIIPVTDDPVDIIYGPIGPEPWTDGHRYALFMSDTRPYVHQLLLKNPAAGSLGTILPIPPMNFSVIAGEQIDAGAYRIGIACTYFGKTAKYWDTTIVITTSYADQPNQFSWRLATAPADAGRSDADSRSWVFVVVGVLGAAGLGFFLWRRRAGQLTPLTQEPR